MKRISVWSGWFWILLMVWGCDNQLIEKNLKDYSGESLTEVYEVSSNNPESRDGDYTLKTQDGKVLRKARYFRGMLWQMLEQRDKSGRLLEENKIIQGTGVFNQYSSDGVLLASFPYKNGRLDGEAVFYSPTKAVISKVLYAAGHPTTATTKAGSIAFFEGDSSINNQPSPLPTAPPTGFDPKVADDVITQLKANDYNAVYSGAYSKYKAAYAQAVFEKYVNYCKALYGEIKTFKRQTYNITGNSEIGEGLEILYDVQFRLCKGGIILSMIKENGVFKLASLSYKIAPYTPITQVRKALDPFLELLRQANAELFYAAGSKRFKEAMKLGQVETMMAEVKKAGGMTDYQLVNHMVGVDGGNIILVAEYEVTIGGKSFVASVVAVEQSPNNFLLEGLQLNQAQ